MSEGNGFVERPTTGWRLSFPADLIAAIAMTAQNGKAVEVPLNGRSRAGVQSALAQALQRAGHNVRLRGRSYSNHGNLTVWAEPR